MQMDQAAMTWGFEKDFIDLVENKDAFMGGGPSLIINWSHDLKQNCDIAVCCLARGGYSVYRTTPHEILRRLQDCENTSHLELDNDWNSAECYFIFDLFVADELSTLSGTEWAIVTWFIMEAVNGGNVVVLPVEDSSVDLNMYGERFGAFIEQTFERVDNGTITKSKKRSKSK
jgi:hypothetical protein